MDIFYNTRCSTSIVNQLLCTVFKDKFIFVWDMKHSLTFVFGTVFIGWNQMQIFDNDNFSIMPKYIFFDNDNLPISFKNADISGLSIIFLIISPTPTALSPPIKEDEEELLQRARAFATSLEWVRPVYKSTVFSPSAPCQHFQRVAEGCLQGVWRMSGECLGVCSGWLWVSSKRFGHYNAWMSPKSRIEGIYMCLCLFSKSAWRARKS